MKNEKNNISIVAQAFYGNRMGTAVSREDIDRFILGYLGDELATEEPIDRTIIHVPNTNNLVIVYNKYFEEEERNRKDRLLKEKNYVLKPLAIIGDMELYSRCIACRINEDGELDSLQKGDYEEIVKYFAE
jgi:hypothetical protein